jgi:3-oxoadipate enol-lactonase
MPTAPIDGVDLYYEVHGEGSPVVLSHGIGGNHASWYQQIGPFAERYRVVVFDHRAFGRSYADPAADARSRFVDDFEALLDHLDIPKTAIVAQSMSGGTAAGFTVRRPERVSALVLADTLVGMDEPLEVKEAMAPIREATANLSQLERVLGDGFRRDNPVGTGLYAAIASFNVANRTNLKGKYERLVSPEDLSATGVPILFLAGLEDKLYPPDQVASFQKHVAGSRFTVIPNAGHSVYFEQPQAFNKAVLDFLVEVGA